MSFSQSLIVHAMQLAAAKQSGDKAAEMENVAQRRAISAAYYALFHHLNQAAVDQIAPNVSTSTGHRIQRWFEHSKMKKICNRFMKATLDQPLLDLIGQATSLDLQRVTRTFIKLQEARHSADYDLTYTPDPAQVQQLLKDAILAMAAWDSIAGSAEANIFVLSLLMWKNWEK